MPDDQNITEKKKSPKKAPQGHRKGDYSPMNVTTFQTYLKIQNILLSNLGIRYASFRDLATIHNHYILNNEGLKVSAIIRESGTNNYRSLTNRLLVLQKHGLIKTAKQRYYPTEIAIRELQSLLKSA